jgi:hypothetical protein
MQVSTNPLLSSRLLSSCITELWILSHFTELFLDETCDPWLQLTFVTAVHGRKESKK